MVQSIFEPSIVRMIYSKSESLAFDTERWRSVAKFKSVVRPGQKFQITSAHLMFGNPEVTLGNLAPLVYPQQCTDFYFVEQKIAKVRVKTGSVQIKIGNKIENFDVSFGAESTFPTSARAYFLERIAQMIPNACVFRISSHLGLSEAVVKYAGSIK